MTTILQKSITTVELSQMLSYAKQWNIGGILLLDSESEIKAIESSTGSVSSAQFSEFLN